MRRTQDRIYPAVALLALAATALGQWVEATIDLNDSLNSIRFLDQLEYNPTSNVIYVAGDGWLGVIDATTRQDVARIPIAEEPEALCWVPEGNKLYVACKGTYPDFDTVLRVVDCDRNQIASEIRVGEWPFALCHDTVGGKLYCANSIDGTLTVIDVSTDSVLSTIPVGERPHDLCFNARRRKVYCPSRTQDSVWVVDAAADSVVAKVPVGQNPWMVCYDPDGDKVYCSSNNSGRHGALTVIDCAGDTVVATLDVWGGQKGLCCDTAGRKVYCGTSQDLLVIDAGADTVLRSLLPGEGPSELLFNPLSSKVYCIISEDRLAVVDTESDSVLAIVNVGLHAAALCLDDVRNAVYCASGWGSEVLALDGVGDTLCGFVRLGVSPWKMCYNPASDKVYTANFGNFGTVSVVDAQTLRLLKTVPVASQPYDICVNPNENKVYVANRERPSGLDSVVSIIDCASDSVIATVRTGLAPLALCHNSRNNKVYCCNWFDGTVAVLDGATDSLLRVLPLGSRFGLSTLAYNAAQNKVYCGDEEHYCVTVLDGSTDSVLAVVPAHSPWYIHCDPKDEKVYVTPRDPFKPMTIICAVGDTVVGREWIAWGVWDAAQDPGASLVYFRADGGVVAYDASADSALRTIPTGGGDGGVVWDLELDKVYCANSADNTVSVIDPVAMAVDTTIAVGMTPGALVWVRPHQRVFVANGNSCDVTVIRDAGGGLAADVTGEALPVRGQSVVKGTLLLAGSQEAVLVDIAGREVTVLRPGSNDVSRLAPGVYFLHSSAGIGLSSPVTKVIVQR